MREFFPKPGFFLSVFKKGLGRTPPSPLPILLRMSSLFINLILKTSHYLHMKVLNERISEAVLEIFAFKVRKRGDFFRKIFPLSNYRKWGQNL